MFTSDTVIHHIANGLLDRTLPKTEWTHAAHIAAGVWFIASSHHDAERDMPNAIRRYNEAVGTRNTDFEGYHHTITLASLRMTKYLLDAWPNEPSLFEATNRIIDAGMAKSNWILDYWSKEVLFSVEARRGWVEPDLKRLPS